MLRQELKRILQSRVFIILAALTAIYFAYLTASYFFSNQQTIAQYQKDAEVTNAFLSEVSDQSADRANFYNTLKEVYLEAENELGRLSAQDTGEGGQMSDEMQAAYDRWRIAMHALDCVGYQFDEYPSFAEKTIKKAYLLSNDESQDEYTIRLNKKAVEEYNVARSFSLIDTKPAGIWHEMYSARYRYFYIFLVFVFVIMSADIFCYEHTHRLCGMVYTSKNGRKCLLFAKLCSLWLIAVVTIAVITIADISVCLSIVGRELIFEPVQVLPIFRRSTADLNFLTLIIYSGVIRLLLLLLVICLVAAISTVSRNALISLSINAVLMFTAFALYSYSIGYEKINSISGEIVLYEKRFELYEKLRGFLPVCFVNPISYVEKFDYMNICGYPISRLAVCITVTILISAVLVLTAFSRFGKASKAIRLKIKKG